MEGRRDRRQTGLQPGATAGPSTGSGDGLRADFRDKLPDPFYYARSKDEQLFAGRKRTHDSKSEIQGFFPFGCAQGQNDDVKQTKPTAETILLLDIKTNKTNSRKRYCLLDVKQTKPTAD
jgi:hypothetical protein